MTLLVLGLVDFSRHALLQHGARQRAALIARVGEGAYKGLYSLMSMAGIVLIAVGYGQYRAAGYIPVWDPPVWTRHLALLLVWLAFICFAAAYLPGRIKARLKHPMLAGVKIWALAHLLANGDLGLDPALRLHPASGRCSRASASSAGTWRPSTAGRQLPQDWRNDVWPSSSAPLPISPSRSGSIPGSSGSRSCP